MRADEVINLVLQAEEWCKKHDVDCDIGSVEEINCKPTVWIKNYFGVEDDYYFSIDK